MGLFRWFLNLFSPRPEPTPPASEPEKSYYSNVYDLRRASEPVVSPPLTSVTEPGGASPHPSSGAPVSTWPYVHTPVPAVASPQPTPWVPTSLLSQIPPPVAAHTPNRILKGRCWVIDGDTIVIDKLHLRLAGIDAPELDHPYGQNAKKTLMNMCRGQIITAQLDGSTSHERHVALCTLEDGRDLSAEMVKAGAALDWPKFSGGRYGHLEAAGLRKRLWRVDARQKGRMPPKAAKQ